MPNYVLLLLLTAFLYSVAVLLLKRAMDGSVGTWRVAFVCNFTTFLLAQTLWFFSEKAFVWQSFFQACAVGVLFYIGQIFTFLALSRGDVSVATPVLGSKVVFVALFTVLVIGQQIPAVWWLAALLTTIATALMRGKADPDAKHKRFVFTVVTTFLSAICYGLCDVLLQKWAPLWEPPQFLASIYLTLGFCSLTLIPFFRGRLRDIPAATWRWLLPGAVTLTGQMGLFTFLIMYYGQATLMNIIYSSRGVWSVVMVWAVGHWFGNVERGHGHAVMIRRLIGSLLIITAIWLVLSSRY